MEAVLEVGHDLDLTENSLVVAIEYSAEGGECSEGKAFPVLEKSLPTPLIRRVQ
jgi:hypothetical protein